MKKSFYLLPAFALLMGACSSEEPIVNDNQGTNYAEATSYLNVNIRPTSGNGTRADETYEQGDGTYEDGNTSENNVSMVRFYFFDADGDAFAVRLNNNTGEYDNYIDWFPNESEIGGPNHDFTIEKTLSATLGLTFTTTDAKPAKVVAIVNPTDIVLHYPSTGEINGMTLEELQDVVTNYLPFQSDNFVMSNSVYVDNDTKEVEYATTIPVGCFAETPAAAAQNPVNIYVERVLARVDFGINMTAATLAGAPEGVYYSLGSYTVIDPDNEMTDDGYPQEAIYVKFLGWNVTATTDQSRLIKSIDKQWGKEILGEGEPWNVSDYHRSFWAINPANVGIQYGNFGEVSGFEDVENEGQAPSLAIPVGDNYTRTYLQENAAPSATPNAGPTTPSKVIIAAQLVNAQGQPLTICEWGYNHYTLDGLKTQLANALTNLFYEKNPGEWVKIEPDMLDFTTVDPIKDVNDKSYYVYAVLTKDAAELTWAVRSVVDGVSKYTQFESEGETSATALINQYIRGIVNHAMIWNSGLTYYYFDIRHLAGAVYEEEDGDTLAANQLAGYYGVVRNHIYRTTVTGVKGLGTPVYDPDLEIIPEVTNPEETVLSAKINILSWRVVENDYELNW